MGERTQRVGDQCPGKFLAATGTAAEQLCLLRCSARCSCEKLLRPRQASSSIAVLCRHCELVCLMGSCFYFYFVQLLDASARLCDNFIAFAYAHH